MVSAGSASRFGCTYALEGFSQCRNAAKSKRFFQISLHLGREGKLSGMGSLGASHASSCHLNSELLRVSTSFEGGDIT